MVLVIKKLRSEGTPDDCTGRHKKRMYRDTIVEFFATFLFIFSGLTSALASGRALASNGVIEDIARVFPIAWTFGISILTMAYSIGHMSGGHMNPAVSLMMVFKRKLSWTKMAFYWVAQFLAALLAAAMAWGGVSGYQNQVLEMSDGSFTQEVSRPPVNLGATTLDSALSAGNGFLLEFMGSTIFFFVIAQTACDNRGIASSLFPAIPIGFSLVAVHCFLIPFTGCGVNPARTFGPSMIVCMTGTCGEVVQSSYWIYWVGPFLASYVVAEVTEWMSIDVDEDEEEAVGDSKKEEGLSEVKENASEQSDV